MIRSWWLADLHYDKRIAYFTARGLALGLRFLIGACALLLGLIPVVVLVSGGGLHTTAAVVCEFLAAAAAWGWTLRWWSGPMPRRAESVAFVVTGDLAIIAASVCDANRLAGAMGLVNLGLLSTLVAVMHSQRTLIAQVALSLAAIVAFVPWLWQDFGWGMAVVKTLILFLTTAAVPVAVQVAVWILAEDAHASEVDQLTGVLNRRGFFARATTALRSAAAGDVVVLVIDLDHFKAINDERGHSEGDRVLAAAARRIGGAVGPDAIVGRVGGEEFAVVALRPRSDPREVGDAVRAALSHGPAAVAVTASVGVVRAPVVALQNAGLAAIEALVDRADQAMYRAKRLGRNTTVVATGARHRLPDAAATEAEPTGQRMLG